MPKLTTLPILRYLFGLLFVTTAVGKLLDNRGGLSEVLVQPVRLPG